jgi:MFS family permease
MISSIIIGFSSATNIVGEQALLLRYTLKEEREKNLGKFRAAQGLGGIVAPMLGAAFFAWGGFMAVFMYVGAGYLLISPLIYR